MKVRFRVPEGGIDAGVTLEFILGDRSHGGPGLQGPRFFVRNVFFALEEEPRPAELPKTEFNWVGAFIVDHLGGSYDNLRALAPSQVGRNVEFSMTLRPQDRRGNISTKCPQSLLLRYEEKEERIEVTPGMLNPAGALQLDGIRFRGEGVARIEVEDPETGIKTVSNPIIIGDADPKLYWGLIHEHTEISDGSGSLDLCYVNMRHGSRLDYGATSDHDHRFETSDLMWEMTREAARRHNLPGEFSTLLGYEWAKWRRNGDGDRNVYYPHNEGNFYRSDTGEFDTPQRLFDVLGDEEALIIPHHTAYTGNFCDWSQHDPEKERLVEIYSVWGSSETSATRGNPLPIRTPRDYDPEWIAVSGKEPKLGEEPVGFVQNALALGWRVGFTGGGDMHKSHPGDDVKMGYPPHEYKAGLTGLWADENTRPLIFRSLHSRFCYATTGARMILKMTVNGSPMGTEIVSWNEKPRHIELTVHGTGDVLRIELVRNNDAVLTEEGRGRRDIGISWDDEEEFDSVALPPATWSGVPFIFYYARVIQVDGEMGWTSPVWIEARS